MLRTLTVAAVLSVAAHSAWADDWPDLRVHSLPLPSPTSLDIRTRVALAEDAKQPAAAKPDDEAKTDEGNPFELQQRLRKRLSESDTVGQQRDLSDKLVFRFNIGFGLDDGKPQCPFGVNEDDCNKSGALLNSGQSLTGAGYQQLRSYTYGDLVAGTRGLVFDSLSSYFAASFRYDEETPVTSSIPSVHDNNDVDAILIRSAYGEAEGDKLFEKSWLRPFIFKAGRMYEYGAGVVHYDGASFFYEKGPVAINLWGGARVGYWGNDLSGTSDSVSGFGLTLDFYKWRKWPLVAFANSISYDSISFANQGVAYQFNRDISLRGNIRSVDDQAARQQLTLRARLSQVTTVFAEIDNRTEDDWVYDMLVRDAVVLGEAPDPQDYLNLGKPLPRTLIRLRAGTVLFDAVDVLVSGAVAVEHASEKSSSDAFSPSFVEGGAAFDLRVRRAIRVGGSFNARIYRRDSVLLDEDPNDSIAGGVLETTGSFGERGFVQAGGRIQYSTGAKGLTASADLYGRVYDHQSPYFESDVLDNERRIGGRFAIQAHIGDQMLVKAIYDVSGSLRYAPEITGIKSLRVMMEGTF